MSELSFLGIPLPTTKSMDDDDDDEDNNSSSVDGGGCLINFNDTLPSSSSQNFPDDSNSTTTMSMGNFSNLFSSSSQENYCSSQNDDDLFLKPRSLSNTSLCFPNYRSDNSSCIIDISFANLLNSSLESNQSLSQTIIEEQEFITNEIISELLDDLVAQVADTALLAIQEEEEEESYNKESSSFFTCHEDQSSIQDFSMSLQYSIVVDKINDSNMSGIQEKLTYMLNEVEQNELNLVEKEVELDNQNVSMRSAEDFEDISFIDNNVEEDDEDDNFGEKCQKRLMNESIMSIGDPMMMVDSKKFKNLLDDSLVIEPTETRDSSTLVPVVVDTTAAISLPKTFNLSDLLEEETINANVDDNFCYEDKENENPIITNSDNLSTSKRLSSSSLSSIKDLVVNLERQPEGEEDKVSIETRLILQEIELPTQTTTEIDENNSTLKSLFNSSFSIKEFIKERSFTIEDNSSSVAPSHDDDEMKEEEEELLKTSVESGDFDKLSDNDDVHVKVSNDIVIGEEEEFVVVDDQESNNVISLPESGVDSNSEEENHGTTFEMSFTVEDRHQLLQTKVDYENQIVSLQEEVEDFQDKITETRQELEQNQQQQLLDTKVSYDKRIEQYVVHINNLEQQLLDAKERKHDLNQSALELTFSIEDRQELLQTKIDYENQIVSLQEQIEDFEDKISESHKMLTIIKQEHFDEIAKRTNLNQELLDTRELYKSRITELENKIKELMEKISESENYQQNYQIAESFEMSFSVNDRQELLQTKVDYEDQIVSLQEKLENLEEQISNSNQQLNKTKLEHRDEILHKDQLLQTITDSKLLYENRILELESLIIEYRTKIAETIETVESVKLQNEREISERDRLVQSLLDSKLVYDSRIEELELAIRNIEQELIDTKENNACNLRSSFEMTFTNEDRHELLQTKVDYEEKIVSLLEEIEQLQSKIGETDQKLITIKQQHQAEFEEKDNRYQELFQSNESYRDRVAEFEQQISEMKQQLTKTFELLETKNVELVELNNTLNNQTMEMTFTTQDRQDLLQTKVDYENQIVSLQEQIENLQEKLSKSVLDFTKIEHNHETLKVEKDRLYQTLLETKTAYEERIEKQNGRVEELTDNAELLRNKLSFQSDSYETTISDLENVVGQLRQDLSSLKYKYELTLVNEHQELKKRHEQITQQYYEAQNENEKLKESVLEMDQQRSELRKLIENYCLEISKLELEKKNAETERMECENRLRAEFKERCAVYDSKMFESNEINTQLCEELQASNFQVEHYSTELFELQEKFSTEQEQVRCLSDKLATIELENSEIVSTKTQLLEQIEQVSTEKQDKIEELNKVLTELRLQVDNYKSTTENIGQIRSNQQAEFNRVTLENQKLNEQIQKLTGQNRELVNCGKEYEMKCENLIKSGESSKRKYEEQISDFKQQLVAANSTLEMLENKNCKLENEKTSLVESFGENEKRLKGEIELLKNSQEAKLYRVEQENVKVKQECQQITADLTEVNKLVDQLQQEQQSLTQSVEQFTEEKRRIQSVLVGCVRKNSFPIDIEADPVMDLDMKFSKLINVFESDRKSINSLESQLAQKASLQEEEKKLIQSITTELTDANKLIDRLKQEQQTLTQTVEQFSEEKRRIQSVLVGCVQKHSFSIDIGADPVADLDKKFSKLIYFFENDRKSINSLESQLAQQTSLQEKEKKLVQSITSELTDANKLIDRLKQEQQTLTQTVVQFSDEKRRIQSVLVGCVQKNSFSIDIGSDPLADLDKKFSKLIDLFENDRRTINTIESQLAQQTSLQQEEKKFLQSIIQDKESLIGQLQKMIDGLHSKSSQLQERFIQTESDRLQTDLLIKCLNDKVAKLEGELKQNQELFHKSIEKLTIQNESNEISSRSLIEINNKLSQHVERANGKWSYMEALITGSRYKVRFAVTETKKIVTEIDRLLEKIENSNKDSVKSEVTKKLFVSLKKKLSNMTSEIDIFNSSGTDNEVDTVDQSRRVDASSSSSSSVPKVSTTSNKNLNVLLPPPPVPSLKPSIKLSNRALKPLSDPDTKKSSITSAIAAASAVTIDKENLIN